MLLHHSFLSFFISSSSTHPPTQINLCVYLYNTGSCSKHLGLLAMWDLGTGMLCGLTPACMGSLC